MIQIAVFPSQFSAFVPRRCIASMIQISSQLPPVMSNPGLIVPDVAPVTPSIVSKHCSYTQSQQ